MSEARKRLPGIIDAVSRDGGRVDITRRGVPIASIVRTQDLDQKDRDSPQPASLGVEFEFDPGELIDVVRDLRSRVGRPRRPASATRKRPSKR